MRTRSMKAQISSTNPIDSDAELELLRDIELEKLNEFWVTQGKHSTSPKTRHKHHQAMSWQGSSWLAVM